MLNYENIQDAMGVTIAMSNDMANAIYQWNNAYMNRSPWLNNEIKSLQLPAAICSEMARLVTMESSICISGSRRAEYIKTQMSTILAHIRQYVEFACAKGGIVFKPYPSLNGIAIDVVHADNFFPVAFNNNGEITAAIFPEFKKDGKKMYTRLEYHAFDGNTYKIQNRAFYSENVIVRVNNVLKLGTEIPLSIVKEWEDIEPEAEIAGLERPLFSYFHIPLANNIDPYSPLGVSIYTRSLPIIKDADEQYGAALWEYKSKETAVQAGKEFFDKDRYGNVRMPAGKERMYFALGDAVDKNGAPFFNVYSPEIRNESYFKGLNEILRRIEFNSNLAYGTLSDPNNVDKTAEEIKASKQRSYSTVKEIQNALDVAIRNLVYAIDAWISIEDQMPDGKIDVSCSWDDSIVVDKEKELMSMQQDAASGMIRKEIYIAQKYGVTEKEAIKMMPVQPRAFPDDE